MREDREDRSLQILLKLTAREFYLLQDKILSGEELLDMVERVREDDSFFFMDLNSYELGLLFKLVELSLFSPDSKEGSLLKGLLQRLSSLRERYEERRPKTPPYTPKEGEYLAFIYYYNKLHGKTPAQHEFQTYFKVTPPTVHSMILKLEKKGFISRTPKKARSIRLLLTRNEIPDLK